MAEVGLDIRGCSSEFQALAGHILFDTRMDFPEAWMSPFDEAAVEFRCSCLHPNANSVARCSADL